MNSNISVTGNIGRDPEIKFSSKGAAFTSISIALTPRWKNGEVWVDGETIWYKAPFFGAKAEEIVDNYGRGVRVKVTGSLQLEKPWTDRAGVHRQGLEISNAEIELAPKDKFVQKSVQVVQEVQEVQLPTQNDAAPF